MAAPQAYWFPNRGVVVPGSPDNLCSDGPAVLVSTALLLVDRPSTELYNRVARRFGSLANATSKRKELFDMDLVQLEFGCDDRSTFKYQKRDKSLLHALQG